MEPCVLASAMKCSSYYACERGRLAGIGTGGNTDYRVNRKVIVRLIYGVLAGFGKGIIAEWDGVRGAA